MNFSDLFKYKTITGVDILIKGEHQYAINLAELKREKGRLVSIHNVENIASLEELKKHIGKNDVMMISVSGKGIIHKKIKRPDADSPGAIMNAVLPGSSQEDFSYQITEISESESFISLIRNTALDSLIGDLKEMGLLAIEGCFLGPFSINNLLTEINGNRIIIPGAELIIQNNRIAETVSLTESSCQPVKVGDEIIPPAMLVSTGNAFAYFAEDHRKIHSANLSEIINEFHLKRQFEVRKLATLGISFFILILNFLLFTSYADKNKALSESYNMNASALQDYDGLKKEYEFKKQFLEENDLLQHSRTSYYADKLAKDLPSSIRWSSVRINPMKAMKDQSQEAFYFDNRVINISGKTEQGNDLNQWMKQLRKYEWISEVTLQNFEQDQKNEAGSFSLRIQVKNNEE